MIRSRLIGMLLSAVIMAFFTVFLLPQWEPSFFSLMIIFLGVSVISWSIGRFLSGESEWPSLLPALLVVAALLLLFTVSPV